MVTAHADLMYLSVPSMISCRLGLSIRSRLTMGFPSHEAAVSSAFSRLLSSTRRRAFSLARTISLTCPAVALSSFIARPSSAHCVVSLSMVYLRTWLSSGWYLSSRCIPFSRKAGKSVEAR